MLKKGTLRLLCALLAVLMLALAAITATAEEKETVEITTKQPEIIISVGKKTQVKPVVTPKDASRKGCTFEIIPAPEEEAGEDAAEAELTPTPAPAEDEATPEPTEEPVIATVDAKGVVKGISEGECQLVITSKYDETVSITVPVYVVVPVKKITLTADPKVILVGQTTTIVPTFAPEEATLQQAVFTSGNEKVATVDENGVVTGVGKGKTYITATSRDGLAKSKISIEVQQQPTAITVTSPVEKLAVGRTANLKAKIEPANANNKTITWISSDETLATVNKSGQVKALAPGQVTITAQCNGDPNVSASVNLQTVQLAKSVVFDEKSYGVLLNSSMQLSVTVSPDNTTDTGVTYKSSKPKVVSVDENGVVTALSAGSATISATTVDGSNKTARCTVNVIVPVTGVSMDRTSVRIGKNQYSTVTADVEPSTATNKNMTWVSSDETIAVVSGTKNKVKVSGKAWGRCEITGLTEDGGFMCSFYVNVGSLRHAVTVTKVRIKDGKPSLVFTNNSDMNITSVTFVMTGEDEYGEPVIMSTRDGEKLYGEYLLPLAPGETTEHGQFTFYHRSDYPNLEKLNVCILGWTTDTGYYDADDIIAYTYDIAENRQEWASYESELYQNTPKEDETTGGDESK